MSETEAEQKNRAEQLGIVIARDEAARHAYEAAMRECRAAYRKLIRVGDTVGVRFPDGTFSEGRVRRSEHFAVEVDVGDVCVDIGCYWIQSLNGYPVGGW